MYQKQIFSWLLLLALITTTSLAEEGFVPLFDGKTMNGWNALPGGTWSVIDGAIVGTQEDTEKRHGMLVSSKQYGDFIVRLKYKSLDGNSGFYFRAQKIDHEYSVKGFQAEIDSSGTDVGGVYETLGRAWVAQPNPKEMKKIYKLNDWNDMIVTAVGGDVTVTLNGTTTVELKNDPSPRRGYFGLQLHGGQKMHVMFKDIEIRELGESALSTTVAASDDGFAPMFDGKTLDGWQTTGNWKVEEGNVVTLHPREGEEGWQRYDAYLTTARKYKDFVLDLEFKINKEGNSGVFLRVGDRKSQVDSGMEVQILDTYGLANPGHHDCGGVIKTAAPSKNMVKPVGQWNRYTITCRGNQLQVVFNGQQVIDLELDKSAMKDRPLEGYIGFQDEAKRVWYRNVRIKELR